jgi:hypothetical protein
MLSFLALPILSEQYWTSYLNSLCLSFLSSHKVVELIRLEPPPFVLEVVCEIWDIIRCFHQISEKLCADDKCR